MAKSQRVSLSEVVAHFEALEDPRSSINQKHPLVSVVVIALMAVLAGADGPTGIRCWAETKVDLLQGLLPLPNGIPSRDVFRRVLMALRPSAFQACFASWLGSLRESATGTSAQLREIIAFDGKTARGSYDKSRGLGPLHLVSAWLTEAGLSLGQIATDEKSNEITAIPELLKLIDVQGAIITIDAMGTQTAIAEQIIKAGGDYVLPVKGNQPGLQAAVVALIDEHLADDFARVKARRLVEEEEGHGRRERRTYIQIPAPKDLPTRDRWKKLTTVGVAVYDRFDGNKETSEVRYYISSLAPGVKQFARAVRQHWRIENTCHWSLDVTYREDALRTRHRQLAENLAWLRRFTLTLLKQHPRRDSLAMKRRRCGWNDDFLLQVVFGTES